MRRFAKKTRYVKKFDKDLKGYGGYQYTIGKLHSAGDTSGEIKLSSNKALHFKNHLADMVLGLYGESFSERICLVKPAGDVVKQHEGSDYCDHGAHYLEIEREIPKEVLIRYKTFCRYIKGRQSVVDNHKLDLVRLLQTKHPELILCGSTAVFLHTGKVYERNLTSPVHDLDFVAPYYIRIEGDEEGKLSKVYEELWESDFGFDGDGNETAKLGGLKVSNRDKWGSGNDFDECVYVNNTPCDLAIRPEQKYEFITFRGFRYKVATLPSILSAKLKYAEQGNAKHMQDVKDLIDSEKVFTIK